MTWTTPARRWSACLLVLGLLSASGAVRGQAHRDVPQVFSPELALPDGLAPLLTHIEPGHDAFTDERDAEVLEGRLAALAAWLQDGTQDAAALGGLFTTTFRGVGPAVDVPSASDADAPLRIVRARRDASSPSLDVRGVTDALRRLRETLGTVSVAEFAITGITREDAGRTWTDVRAEIVGTDGRTGRRSSVGTWRLGWRLDDGVWRLDAWTDSTQVLAQAATPLFAEVTDDALADVPAHREQFALPLDTWMATLDAVLTRDSNGHHGVSVGDADGDGLDDLYVAQPSGLPNRLLRSRGDGTFEDATERSGLGLLDDTAHTLFADVDNDGDQDLVVATSLQPLLFVNDGTGVFTQADRAFGFARPVQGVLTGLAMADFDRDGFLDVYLCVYSYFFGAGGDQAGTPMPYHDARNGPPGMLFRNDGRGRFVDVTAETGIDAANDRYHFAAAWADYDEDGWPDLLVANDFGVKNLYRNLGRQADGRVRFEDVAARAGALDHGAGMSSAFVDYDNDGRLDIYAGNMWTAPGQRVTASPAFMPDAPEDVRALYRRHARGNTLLRNRGDGTFDDVTVDAGVAMGRWAWASDAVDIDSDGFQDLYVVNGMLTRSGGQRDLESFFWRQVVARSPLTRVKGTPYDEAWRAINHALVRGSIAGRQRNVFLRNDGHGRFDDVSGAVGLDLDQDGRSFAVLDLEGDGDPDLAVMAARNAPHLRIFRNDHPARRTLTVRLEGRTSNRDAVGARVRVETDTGLRVTRLVSAGSGFLSQHTRTMVVGLGDSGRVQTLTVHWPSGESQVFRDLPVDVRLRLVEGGAPQVEPLIRTPPAGPSPAQTTRRSESHGAGASAAPDATWFTEPVVVPDFTHPALDGSLQSLGALKGTPSLLLFWRSDAPASRQALDALARDAAALRSAGVQALTIALDPPEDGVRVRAAAPSSVPTVHASRELALTWAIVQRHLYMFRQPLPLPTLLLLDADGRLVRAYRTAVDAARVRADAAALDADASTRLARALPFPGRFHLPLAQRNYLPFGRELIEQGLDAAAVPALELAAQADPSAFTLYRLGTLLVSTGTPARARLAFERALALDATLAEAHNDLGALVAQDGDVEQAISHFRAALAAMPDYPDALNNLGYALLLTGRADQARTLYERALALQPDFSEALNNLGLLLGRSGDLVAAERYFREALETRPAYGEAANNLALTLAASGRADEAVAVLEALLARAPELEPAYVTLAKLHLTAGRVADGLTVLQRLLQRNPTHPVALALVAEFRRR